jgi:hypothetical protein
LVKLKTTQRRVYQKSAGLCPPNPALAGNTNRCASRNTAHPSSFREAVLYRQERRWFMDKPIIAENDGLNAIAAIGYTFQIHEWNWPPICWRCVKSLLLCGMSAQGIVK